MEPVEVAAPDAQMHFDEALRVAQEQGSKISELRAAMSLVRLEKVQGRAGEGRADLAQAYHAIAEGHDLADLRDARALLAEGGR